MANWRLILQLGDVYHKGLPIPELAGIVAERLAALTIPATMLYSVSTLGDVRDDIVDAFKSVAANPNADADDFDGVMEQLYDWADTELDNHWNGRKVCWVDTISRKVVAQ